MNPENLPIINPDLLIPLVVITGLLIFVNLGFYIYVSRMIKKAGKDSKNFVGKYTWLRYVYLGWVHAKELQIVDIMAFWSFILFLTGVGVFSFILALMQRLP